MISAHWETPPKPLTEQEESTKSKKVVVSSNPSDSSEVLNAFEELQKEMNEVLSKLSLEAKKKGLIKPSSKQETFLNYDPKGKIPFPKFTVNKISSPIFTTFDLDDKQDTQKELDDKQDTQKEKVSKLLAKYGITCPNADYAEVTHDPDDPSTTVITIKATYF